MRTGFFPSIKPLQSFVQSPFGCLTVLRPPGCSHHGKHKLSLQTPLGRMVALLKKNA